jgi:hypothetical protein
MDTSPIFGDMIALEIMTLLLASLTDILLSQRIDKFAKLLQQTTLPPVLWCKKSCRRQDKNKISLTLVPGRKESRLDCRWKPSTGLPDDQPHDFDG